MMQRLQNSSAMGPRAVHHSSSSAALRPTAVAQGLRLRNVGARRGHSAAAAANAAGANDDGLARRLVKAAAAAAVVADAPPTEANAPSAEAGPQTFDWAKAWYPVLAEEHVDPNKPNKVQINGRDVVMWRDGQGAWHAQEDRCPHRLAALSDGFVDVEHNQLVCSYHGWRFDRSGACVDIPQISNDAAALSTACSSARSCIATFPVMSKGGLLWVWNDSSPGAAQEAAKTEPVMPPQVLDETISPAKGRWFVREQPYSFTAFLENVLDPSHVDFAHDGVAGFSAEKHRPLSLELLEDSGPKGFRYRIVPSRPGVRPSILTFAAPCHVSIIEEPSPAVEADAGAARDRAVRPGAANSGIRSGLVFYVHPTRPGWSRFHGTSFVTDASGKPLKTASIFSRGLPPWLTHTLGHTFLAGDDAHLHAGSKKLAQEGHNPGRSYYAVSQDAAVLKLHAWLERYAAGSPPWPEHMRGAEPVLANLDLRPEQVLDRYDQHVRHCAHCSGALDGARRAKSAATVAAAVLAAAAVAAAAFKSAAVAAASTASPAAALAAATGLPAVVAAALSAASPAVLLGLAAVALLVRGASSWLVGQFFFQPFDRKPFPPSATFLEKKKKQQQEQQ